MNAYSERKSLRMHMPGHKGKAGFYGLWAETGRDPFAFDLTEIAESDDLYAPQGPLLRSQQLLAELYGAKQSFYLVNGASVGLMAALLSFLPSARQRSAKVLLPRAAHRSLWQGCILGDYWPLSAAIEFAPASGLPLPPSLDALKQLVDEHPDIVAAVLLSPDYYGIVADLKEQIRFLHARGIAVIVDEAHGTHLRFLPGPLADALQCGADIVIQSPHKTAGALTQAAWMHCQGERIDAQRLQEALRLLHSSSPSFLLLLSLEEARQQLALQGHDFWYRMAQRVPALKSEIAELGLSCLEENEIRGFPSVKTLDISKLYLRTAAWGMTGFAASQRLQALGIVAEMADSGGVLFLFGPGDSEESLDALYRGIAALRAHRSVPLSAREKYLRLPSLQRRISPRQAWAAPVRQLALREAAGEVVAAMIIPYPPGIPLATPGEELSREAVELIENLLEQGAYVTGVEPRTRLIKVVQ